MSTEAALAASPVDSPILPPDSSVFDGWAKAQESLASDSPEAAAAAPAKEPDPPAADPPPAQPTTDEPAKPEQPDSTAADDEAAASPDADEALEPNTEAEAEGAAAPVVEFVEDEPFESFTEKVEQFFDAYDVDPSIVAMKTGYEKQIAALTEQVNGQVEINENVKSAVEAFSAIDEYRKDEETGVFVPKTNEAVAFVQATKSPDIFKQFVIDAMSAPSPKYKHLGFTMLHEMYVDAGVPPNRIDEFVKYVSGEALPPPLYPDLPANVPQDLAEAFFKNSALRRVIEDSAETLAWSEADKLMYPEQYAEAKAQHEDALAALNAQQKGINQERQDKINSREKAIADQRAFETTVLAGTQDIQKAELASFGKDLNDKLAVFVSDPAARDLQVLSYKNLILNALADDVYGEDARATLKAQGITVEFSKAQVLFQQIQDAVAQRELILAQTKDEKAANKAVAKPLTNALRELGVMRRQIVGKVAQVITRSYTNGALKPAGSPDKPQLRPQLKGGRTTSVKGMPTVDFHDPQAAGKWYAKALFGQPEE